MERRWRCLEDVFTEDRLVTRAVQGKEYTLIPQRPTSVPNWVKQPEKQEEKVLIIRSTISSN